MTHHHEPFKSLSPLSWPDDISPHLDAAGAPSENSESPLGKLLTTTLADALLLVESIPSPTAQERTDSSSTPLATVGRARSQTDPSAAHRGGSGGSASRDKDKERDGVVVQKLRGEWKDIKIPPKDNPHGISMYKLAAKDGKGAWFARRSLHVPGRQGAGGEVGFEMWEAALRKEMQETLARCKGKEPGTGNIRGIGAEKRVKRVEIPEGVLEVYQVSARFPGPTTPRDFVTVLMMPRPAEGKSDRTGRQPRQFVIVSRPCDGHPDCPSRSGFIRGQYESVEVIREVPVDKPLRRVKSSIDLSRDDVKQLADEAGDHASKEAVLRAAKKAAESEGEQDGKVSFPGSPAKSSGGRDEEDEMAIEWLMVTRSDPGGSVPRFMVEKGTPGGIVNDAGKFIKWLSSQKREDLLAASTDGVDQQETKPTEEFRQKAESGESPAKIAEHDHLQDGDAPREGEQPPQGGLYGMFTNALGAASSAVASRVAAFSPSYPIVDGTGSADESYASSEASFESAEEGSPSSSLADQASVRGEASAMDAASTKSAHSTLSENPPLSHQESTSLSRTQAQHEKELRKLKQRMVKAQEKLERSQAKRRADSKSSNKGGGATTTDDEATAATAAAKAKEKEKDDLALAKLREKHEREIAKQEEKYRRELKRLEEKHAAEERKAAERRRKAAERKERANIQMELERTRAERDVALKQIEMLKAQVGELQAQNTMLVAKLGKEKEKGN